MAADGEQAAILLAVEQVDNLAGKASETRRGQVERIRRTRDDFEGVSVGHGLLFKNNAKESGPRTGHAGEGRADLSVQHQISEGVQIGRFAVEDYQAGAAPLGEGRKTGSGVDDQG